MATFDVALSALTNIAVADTSKMTLKLAKQITGGIGKPSKMPGHAFGLSALDCRIGSKLTLVEGSACWECYARRNNYMYPSVKIAHQRRLERLYNPRWVEAMVFQIRNTGDDHFRFLDSGDLQSLEMLRNIVAVANALPEVKFWMPTQEHGMVELFKRSGGIIPANLVIRYSTRMKNAAPPLHLGQPCSTQHTSESLEPASAKICRAYQNHDKCGDCRACWDATVLHVSYLKH